MLTSNLRLRYRMLHRVLVRPGPTSPSGSVGTRISAPSSYSAQGLAQHKVLLSIRRSVGHGAAAQAYAGRQSPSNACPPRATKTVSKHPVLPASHWAVASMRGFAVTDNEPVWTAVEALWTTLLACPIAGLSGESLQLHIGAKPDEAVSRSARCTRSSVVTGRARSAGGSGGEPQSVGTRAVGTHRLWITCGQQPPGRWRARVLGGEGGGARGGRERSGRRLDGGDRGAGR